MKVRIIAMPMPCAKNGVILAFGALVKRATREMDEGAMTLTSARSLSLAKKTRLVLILEV